MFIFFFVLRQSPGGSPETRTSICTTYREHESVLKIRKKEHRQKMRMIMQRPLSNILINFLPPIYFFVAKSTSPVGWVVRRFFFECTRSGLLRDYTTTSARRFIAIIYNRYTFTILVRMAHIHIQYTQI